jgi:hypothetical protein
VNFETTSGGSIGIEIQDAAGKPLPGFTLADCKPLSGDSIEQTVTWAGGSVANLSGIPVRLRFVMQDADVYSIKFSVAR